MLVVGRKRLAAAVLVIAAAGCTGGSTGVSAGGKPVQGGTAVWAGQPGSAPNYIFPFASSAYFGVSNIVDFSYLMYRPLYWFGRGSQLVLNPARSLAGAPVFHGRNVTITLKHYMWSDGTPVTASNVVFWLHMMRAVPQHYGGYSGFPANVTDIRAASPTTLTMTMDKAYSPTWFLYNDLSQVIPMPAVWDRTARGPAHCTTMVKHCAAVYKYLDAQSKAKNTYVSSPLWSVVDGPWRQLYFRQAMAYLMNQAAVIAGPLRGYGGPPSARWPARQ
jgi:peptide/nickel transport system substrate-binding protein